MRDFNSLDSQREVCSAYITSQCHKAWSEPATRNDGQCEGRGSGARAAIAALVGPPALQAGLLDDPQERGRAGLLMLGAKDLHVAEHIASDLPRGSRKRAGLLAFGARLA